MKPIFVTLGNHLKKKRLESGVSQMEVARKLGYTSPQFVSNVERGLCSFPLNKLKILVDLYKLDREQLTQIILSEHEKDVRRKLGGKAKKRA